MHTEIKEQSSAIKELTASLKDENILKEQFKCIGDQFREKHLESFTLIKRHGENTDIEMFKLLEGITQMIEEKWKNSPISLLSEVRFLVEQLQIETQ